VKQLFYSALILLMMNSSAFAAEKMGVISRDASLYAKPFKDADTIAELPATTAIVILKRKGGWYEIKAADKQGWVRLTRVRLNRKGNANQESDSGVGELLTGLATGRGKSNQDTTATAVKGLSEEELRSAQPDQDALNSLDSFAVDSDASGDSGLQTRQVDFQETANKDGADTQPPARNTTDEEDEE